MLAWLTGAWQVAKFVMQYGPAAVSLVQQALEFLKALQAKHEEAKREGNIDKAGETKNPDDLENSYRTGGGGA
jgi:hypothetical protein